MPSMSYCKFENTEIDMRQCVEAMEDAGDMEDLDMNDYEKRAFARLFNLCYRFIEEAKRLQEEDSLENLQD